MRFVAATLAASALWALVLATPAAADTTYADTTGENPAAADIGTIVVSNDPAAQTVTFKVQILNMPTVEANAEIDVLVDADRNPTTGESGFDDDFFLGDGGWGFDRWDGTQFQDAPEVASLPVTYGAGLLVVTMPLSVLGGVTTGSFDFAVLTFRGDPSAPVTDQAPDAAPPYTYTLAAPPPPQPKPKEAEAEAEADHRRQHGQGPRAGEGREAFRRRPVLGEAVRRHGGRDERATVLGDPRRHDAARNGRRALHVRAPEEGEGEEARRHRLGARRDGRAEKEARLPRAVIRGDAGGLGSLDQGLDASAPAEDAEASGHSPREPTMSHLHRAIVLTATLLGTLAAGTVAQAGNGNEVLLCHGTASATNPYVLISVSENALNGHFDGSEPGHGWQNAPDFLFDPTYGSCAEQFADMGGTL